MNVGIRLQCGRRNTFEGKVCSAADMRHAGTPYIWTITAMRSGRDQVVRCDGFFGHQFVAEHAGFFARGLGRKAPQQDQQRLGGLTDVTPLTLYREWILRITRAWGAEI